MSLNGFRPTVTISGLEIGFGTANSTNSFFGGNIWNQGTLTLSEDLITQGKTLQEVLAAKVTAPYDGKVPGGLLPAGAAGTSADRFVSMVYSQLKGSQ